MIQILELFGGIGSPRCALRNLNIPTKAIDYVEINEKAVRSYNSMFREELEYKTQTVVGWNLKPDILIHGSPCQDMSIAGHQGKATGDGRINRGKGSDEGSGTRSSLMWETIHIIENMGEWRPRYVIWENVKNVKSKYMRPNFDRYMVEMEKLGYTNNYAVLDAREFGLPQARERVFTVSVLNGEKFEFDDLIRTPAQVIDRGDGRYRYLTERECWRLMGYTDEDFDRAKAVQERNGKYYKALYDQAGNSIAVPIFESIFRKIILQEVA
jgi:DNA (cytosine-5)-methyltransferase 1